MKEERLVEGRSRACCMELACIDDSVSYKEERTELWSRELRVSVFREAGIVVI